MHKLRDLPGIMDLERRARLNPRLATEAAVGFETEFDEVSLAIFGVTYDQVFDIPGELPEDSPVVEDAEADEVAAFARAGWDVTDEYGRPLLVIKHFEWQLAHALAGLLKFKPGVLEGAGAEGWGDALQAEAAKWRRKS